MSTQKMYVYAQPSDAELSTAVDERKSTMSVWLCSLVFLRLARCKCMSALTYISLVQNGKGHFEFPRKFPFKLFLLMSLLSPSSSSGENNNSACSNPLAQHAHHPAMYFVISSSQNLNRTLYAVVIQGKFSEWHW